MRCRFHLPLISWGWIPILCFAGMIFLSSCGPTTTTKPSTKPTKYEVIESPQVMWMLRRDNGIEADFVMPDNYYIIVDEEWFKKEVMPGFNNFLFNNGIESYAALRNDCDDFARAFSFYVRIKFRTMRYMEATPAVGDFYYAIPSNNDVELDIRHAINIGIFFDKNGNKVIRFIEPQSVSFVEIDTETKKYYVNHLGL